MQLSRRQIIAYVAVAVVVVAVGVRYVVLPRQAGPSEAQAVVLAPVAASPSAAAARQAASPAASPAPDVMVYVCGAVRTPGVVRLPAGARVTDALELAGGPPPRRSSPRSIWPRRSRTASRSSCPSAARGGGRPRRRPPARRPSGALGVSPGGATPGALININTASLEELDALDGVGPSTAQKIIDYRTENGGFKTVDEIKEVPGIGDAKFAAMKDSITV